MSDVEWKFQSILSECGIAANYEGDGQYSGQSRRLRKFFDAGTDAGYELSKEQITRLQSEVERLRGRVAEFGDRITYGVLAQGEFVGYEDCYDDAIELAEECGGTVFGIYAQRLRQQAAEIEGGAQ